MFLLFIEGTYNGSRQVAVWNPVTSEGHADIVDDIDDLKMIASTLWNNRISVVMEVNQLVADTLHYSAELKSALKHVTVNSIPLK
jgi:hypothetical protein